VVPLVNPAAGMNVYNNPSFTEPPYQVVIHSEEDGQNKYGPPIVSYVNAFKDWVDNQSKPLVCVYDMLVWARMCLLTVKT
jgi:hypothetical protein